LSRVNPEVIGDNDIEVDHLEVNKCSPVAIGESFSEDM
jgi:hypothetical protein